MQESVADLKSFRLVVPCGLVVRIRRSHRRGRGSIPRMGGFLFPLFSFFSQAGAASWHVLLRLWSYFLHRLSAGCRRGPSMSA